MCVTDLHDITLAVKVALNPNTTSRFNSLTNDNILVWSKSKVFVDDKINVVKMIIPLLDKVENTVGKVGSLKVGTMW